MSQREVSTENKREKKANKKEVNEKVRKSRKEYDCSIRRTVFYKELNMRGNIRAFIKN